MKRIDEKIDDLLTEQVPSTMNLESKLVNLVGHEMGKMQAKLKMKEPVLHAQVKLAESMIVFFESMKEQSIRSLKKMTGKRRFAESKLVEEESLSAIIRKHQNLFKRGRITKAEIQSVIAQLQRELDKM